jgi:hypothetical protein
MARIPIGRNFIIAFNTLQGKFLCVVLGKFLAVGRNCQANGRREAHIYISELGSAVVSFSGYFMGGPEFGINSH